MTRIAIASAFAALTLAACQGEVVDEGQEGAIVEGELVPERDVPVETGATPESLIARGGGGTTSYNCKRDKRVDVPAELLEASAVGPSTLHFRAGNGSDPSGSVWVSSYELVDSAGAVVNVYPQVIQNCPYGDDPMNVYTEPFTPGETYSITAVSSDACGNVGRSAARTVTLPELDVDTAPPTSTGPLNTRIAFFFSISPGVTVYANDASGIDYVEFFHAGTKFGSQDYAGRVHVWSDPRGESYYSWLPSELYGTTATITAVVYDRAGNSTTVTGDLAIPLPQ